MASNAANEQELGVLHNITATVLKQTLDVFDVAQKAYIATGGLMRESNEEEGIAALYSQPPVLAPAMLAAIIKFLKDNDITAAPEQGNEVSALEDALARKRIRRLKQAVPINTVPHVDEEETLQKVWTA
jgi:hypothetical protein